MKHLLHLVFVLLASASAVAQCTVYAGTLAAEPIEQVSPDSFRLRAFRLGNVALLPGYTQRFFLSDAATGQILAFNTELTFGVNRPGRYLMHTVVGVFDNPNSPDYLADVLRQPDGRTIDDLIAEIGTRCADVDRGGVYLFVPTDFGLPCTADAGKLDPGVARVNTQTGAVQVIAHELVASQASARLEKMYVLTKGEQNVVRAFGNSPTFQLPAGTEGLHTVYAFVADTDDPLAESYFELNQVRFGQTTIDQLTRLYVDQDLCANLDVDGGQVFVNREVSPGACVTEAGLLAADTTQVSAAGDSILLVARRVVSAMAMDNQDLRYLLSRGSARRVVGFSDEPSFWVARNDSFYIHALTVETTDPSDSKYFDLPGSLSSGLRIAQLERQLVQAGVCANLDTKGAGFGVSEIMTSSISNASPEFKWNATRTPEGIEVSSPHAAYLRIYDLMGRVLLTQHVQAGRTVVAVQLSAAPLIVQLDAEARRL